MAQNFLKILRTVVLLLVTFITNLVAEPWVDTRNAQLRADIEYLSEAGIINVPINTWPLMWSGILQDLDNAEMAGQSQSIVNSYTRVFKAGERAAKVNRPSQTVKLSLASDAQLFRYFGDSDREQGQLTVRQHDLTQHFAYNLEVTQLQDPWDNEDNHLDNSYLAMVLGNWVLGIGTVERWWGPSWNSSLILSNNARPTNSLFLQKNYSDRFTLPILSYLGPWTMGLFVSELDDQRTIDKAKLLGLTMGFKPTQDLEINLRRTALWGGDGKSESFDSFLKLLSGDSDSCNAGTCIDDELDNPLSAIDISWTIPYINANLYVQSVSKDKSVDLTLSSFRQWGIKRSLNSFGLSGFLYLEQDNTSNADASSHHNTLYNHSIYQTGYRYQGRSIGATWDNDSKVSSLGFVGYLNNGDGFELRYSSGDINLNSIDGSISKHSITTQEKTFSQLSAKWQRSFNWGDIHVGVDYNDRLVDEYHRQSEEIRLNASWTYKLF